VFFALGAYGLLVDQIEPVRLEYRRGFKRLATPLLVVTLALLFLGLLSTGSRGALVGLAAGLVMRGQWAPKRLTPSGVVALIFGTLMVAGAAVWYLDQQPLVMHRIDTTVEGAGPNIAGREELWEAAREAFYGHPVFGLGYGQFPEYMDSTRGLLQVAHQTYLTAAAELGLFGLIALLWLLSSVVRDTFGLRLAPGRAVAASLRGFVVATGVQGLFTNVDQFRALWIVIGLVAALKLFDRCGGEVPTRRSDMYRRAKASAIPRRVAPDFVPTPS
jgi:O-antigen ligase